MQIRAASVEDAEEAVAVVRRSITELCAADHHDDAEFLRLWLANKTGANMCDWIKSCHVLIAVEGTTIQGVASITPGGHVTLNYVSPDARLRGVSTALLAAIEELATGLGLEAVQLESTETAHRFYLERGFCDTGAPRRRLGSTCAYPMVKPIGSGSRRT